MLEKLMIQNFQSHSKTVVEFDENVTTIVGSSDVGKSAIIRSLSWVSRNTPNGNAFIKDGSDGAAVRLFVDGHRIVRRRSKSENFYGLDDHEFKSFGSGLPDPIADVLKIGDLNFQEQHDAPFWFSLTAGEVSRRLNSVVDLGMIDDAIGRSGQCVRRLSEDSRVLQEQVEKVAKQLEELTWVDEADAFLRKIEKLQKRARVTFDNIETLGGLIGQVHSRRIEVHSNQMFVDESADVIKLLDKVDGRRRQVVLISRIIDDLKKCESAVSRRSEIPEVDALEEKIRQIGRLESTVVRMEKCLQTVDRNRKRKQEADEELRRLQEELDSIPLICTECGRPLEEEG